MKVVKETGNSLSINGDKRSGFVVLYKSLDLALSKVGQSGVVVVGLGNLAYATGYIGAYAREAVENGYIFLGFNSSPGGLVSHGARKDLWGTNPMTVGIPGQEKPVILDMASSIITWGDLLVADQQGSNLVPNVAVDANGAQTTDPKQAMVGGLLPVGGHKGSGLALMVELLAGALTKTYIDWASSYVLIDPGMFMTMSDFKKEVADRLQALKTLPKAEGVAEIYYPGERSEILRKQNLERGEIEVNEELIGKLK